jgi:hypothetical protein
MAYVHAADRDLQAKGRIRPGQGANKLTGLVTGSTDKDGFADADFVIEAVFEEMSVKKQVFAEVEAVVSPECVLATNTSSLSITEMAADLEHPERVVGFHFFNPVAVMPLLEIIPGEQTDDPHSRRPSRSGKRCARPRSWSRTRRASSSTACWGASWASTPGSSTRAPGGHRRPRRGRGAGTDAAVSCCLGWSGPAIALHNSETLHRAFGDRFYVSPSLRGAWSSGQEAVRCPTRRCRWPRGRRTRWS